MTRYERVARTAVARALMGRQDPISLYDVSCIADTAARQLGKRTELYGSLHDYQDMVPSGWRQQWLTAQGGSGDGMLMVVPPGWQEGQTRSRSLLLGGGPLVAYRELVG